MFTDPAVLIAAPCIVFAAYTVFGITGFGSALISIPLLAHFLPLDAIVPLMVLVDFSAALTSGMRAGPVVAPAHGRAGLPLVPRGGPGGVPPAASAGGRARRRHYTAGEVVEVGGEGVRVGRG